MTQEELFMADAIYQSQKLKRCKTCKHRERWECGSKIIQYCSKRRSKRTTNGLLKIKANNVACLLYEEVL